MLLKPADGYLGAFCVVRYQLRAVDSQLPAWQVCSSFSCSLSRTYSVTSRMALQGSSVDASVGNPGVSPTSRLVAGTSVLATIIPSSMAPRAIPGASTSAGKYVLSRVI